MNGETRLKRMERIRRRRMLCGSERKECRKREREKERMEERPVERVFFNPINCDPRFIKLT